MEPIAMGFGRSPTFWWMFSTYGMLVLGATTTLGVVATRQIEQFELQEAEHDLRVKAFLVRESIGTLRPHSISELQTDAKALNTEIDSRITFLDGSGNVLADSARDPAVMDNHASRPEIIAAGQEDGNGFIRRSQTTDCMTVYVARRVPQAAAPVAFVRVASGSGRPSSAYRACLPRRRSAATSARSSSTYTRTASVPTGCRPMTWSRPSPPETR